MSPRNQAHNHANSWHSSSSYSSLVSLSPDSASLYASVHGPPRTPGSPIVLVFAGSGDVASSYIAVSRLLAPFVRHFIYDRSGLGRSEDGSPTPADTSMAEASALELSNLLRATDIGPPYILLAHSYGAILAREFLELHNDDVLGAVLADPSTEEQYKYFHIPNPDVVAVLGNLNFATVTGLRAEARLSRDEWRARAKDMARGSETVKREIDNYVSNCSSLGEKLQIKKKVMGGRPLSIIRCNGRRDFERIYAAGVEARNGSESEQLGLRRFLDRWDDVDDRLKRSGLEMCLPDEEGGHARYVECLDTGHNVHITKPEVVVEEVQWVLRCLKESAKYDAW